MNNAEIPQKFLISNGGCFHKQTTSLLMHREPSLRARSVRSMRIPSCPGAKPQRGGARSLRGLLAASAEHEVRTLLPTVTAATRALSHVDHVICLQAQLVCNAGKGSMAGGCASTVHETPFWIVVGQNWVALVPGS